MVTLTNVQGEVAVDTAAGESVSSEQLLAQVLDDDTVAALAQQARGQGVALLGAGGLLQQLTKRFLEATLEDEMDAHLGRGRH